MNAGILDGLRILELGHFVAAPFATRLLADLGAEVIKIEPKTGDPVRQWGEQIDGRSLWWSMHGRNKKSVTLDLKSPRARDIVLDLAKASDAVIENFRPGALAKLGLSDEAFRQARPDLVIAHVSGYGQDGPDRDRAAFGVIGEAIGGLRHLTDQPPGTGDLPPVRVGVSLGDSLAGLYAALGVMAALWRRGHGSNNAGATIDVALTESVLSLMEGMLPEYGALGKIKQPTGGAIATAAPTNAYPTKDGAWVLIAANSEPLFGKLMDLIGHPELIGTPEFIGNAARVRHVETLDRLIGDWTRQKSITDLLDLLKRADVPSSKVYTAADCVSDPQFIDRRMVQEVYDPQFGRAILQAGVVPRFVEAPGAVRWPGPALGAHNEDILIGLLGLSTRELEELKEEGILT